MADRELVIKIIGDSKSAERAFAKSTAAARGFNKSIGSLSVGATAGIAAAAFAINKIGDAIGGSFREFSEQAKVAAQTNAAIKSTGGVANVTAQQVDRLATRISNLSGIDDEAVQAGENLLLTFKNVRNEVGKGNAIFDRATRSAVNLSVAGFGSIDTTSKQLGKALNDPARGLTALGRAGVTFTAQAKAQIKALVESNRLLDAQKIILSEVETQVGGSAKALGQTLPGQINRLRETFRNLGGELVGSVAPAFTTALEAVNRFVGRISEAEGVRAKFSVAFEGVKEIGAQLFSQVRAAVQAIDWDAALQTARTEIPKAATRALELLVNAFRTVGAAIGRVLGAIDWRALGRFIGNQLVSALGAVAQLLAAVDWAKVGGAIVRGLVNFLRSVPWKQLIVGIFKVVVAAIRSVGNLLLGAGEALGKALLDGVRAGFDKAKSFLFKTALRIALKIIEPFNIKILGVHLVPGLDGVINTLKTKLAEMETGTSDSVKRINATLSKVATDTSPDVNQGMLDLARASQGAGKGPRKPPPVVPPPVVDTTVDRASRANQFFDNKVSRALSRVQDIQTVKAQIAKLKEIAALINRRIDATKDITRRLNLEDTLLDVARQISAAKQQLAAEFVDALRFGVDKAAATRQLSDDLDALRALQEGLQQRVKAEGRTLELQRQLLEVRGQITATQQQIRDRRKAARQSAQFDALGLDATGQQKVPGVDALRTQLLRVDDAIKGTFLNTAKTKGLLDRIRRVLAGGLGAVGKDVRQKIKELLDQIDGDLKSRSNRPLTSFRKANTDKLVAGLGLSRDQAMALRGRLSQIGATGQISTPGQIGALGFAIPGGGAPIVVNSTIELDGQVVARSTTKHQSKTRARSSGQRGETRR